MNLFTERVERTEGKTGQQLGHGDRRKGSLSPLAPGRKLMEGSRDYPSPVRQSVEEDDDKRADSTLPTDKQYPGWQ